MRAMNVCRECRRHVYAEEASCPFCGSTEPRTNEHIAPRAQRIARAAGYASAVLIAGLGGGCAASRVPADDAGTAVVDAGRDAGVAMSDAAVADAGTDAAGPVDAGADADAEVPVPLYGGAFPDPRRRAVI